MHSAPREARLVKVVTRDTSRRSHANDTSETNRSSEPYVADRFGVVADVFDQVISEATPGGGACLAVWVEGHVVIDLWGGNAGHDRRRSADTLDFLWSGTKGLVALCMLMLVSSGELALAGPVSYY